jgi:hypothetical protein
LLAEAGRLLKSCERIVRPFNVYKVCGVGAAKPRRGPPTPRSVPAIASGRKSVGGVRTTAIVVVYYTNSSHRVCEAWSGLVSEHSLFDNSLDANL